MIQESPSQSDQGVVSPLGWGSDDIAGAGDKLGVLDELLGLEAQECPDDRGAALTMEVAGKTDHAEPVRLRHVKCGEGVQDQPAILAGNGVGE